MSKYGTSTKVSKSRQPQPVSRRTDEKQVKNSQGYYVYRTDTWSQLSRFLILGTDKPTYHAGTKNVGKNVKLVEKLVKQDGVRVVETVLKMDNNRQLIRKDQALFVLAYALGQGDLETRKSASQAVAKVVRTGRDIANFVAELNDVGSWGRLKRNTVSNWYNMPVEKLGYQVVKYRNTGQWEHRNILRLAHVTPKSEGHNNLFSYLVGKDYDSSMLPEQVKIFEDLKEKELSNELTEKYLVEQIRKYNLTHEMVPTQFKNSSVVWKALAENMPFRALTWNLSTFSRLGMLGRMSKFEKLVLSKLTNREQIIGSRIHPFTLLVTLRNYASGKGLRNTWKVNQAVVDALETALDILLENTIEKTGKTYGLLVDTSGSMDWSNSNGVAGSNIKPIEAAGVMACVQSRQGNSVIIGVNRDAKELRLSAKTPLSNAIDFLARNGGGSTNLSAGMEYLIQHNINVDAVIYYTDNEVNRGYNVVQMFDQYKKRVNPNAKMIVVGMTANNFSIADASRNDMLDIVGFDTTAPTLIDSFIQGW